MEQFHTGKFGILRNPKSSARLLKWTECSRQAVTGAFGPSRPARAFQGSLTGKGWGLGFRVVARSPACGLTCTEHIAAYREYAVLYVYRGLRDCNGFVGIVCAFRLGLVLSCYSSRLQQSSAELNSEQTPCLCSLWRVYEEGGWRVLPAASLAEVEVRLLDDVPNFLLLLWQRAVATRCTPHPKWNGRARSSSARYTAPSPDLTVCLSALFKTLHPCLEPSSPCKKRRCLER